MGHTAEGVLRRLLDEPDGVASTDREHASTCPTCRASLDRMRADADGVASLLGGAPDLADDDVDAAWLRLSAAASAPAAGTRTQAQAFPAQAPALRLVGGTRWRSVRRPAVAVVAAAAVLAGAGTAAANGWLPVFRTEKVAPVAVRTSDLLAIPDLSGYGKVDVVSAPDLRGVDGAAAAAKESGLPVPSVAQLPRGLRSQPSFQVSGPVEATFTFDPARAAAKVESSGKSLPAPPAGVAGSKVRLKAGPGLAAIWPSNQGVPGLIVGRAVAPTAESSGVAFPVIRDYLLSLPGLPKDLAAQLRTFTADGTTLPLPFPADMATTSQVQVGGVPATLLRAKDKTMTAVVWVKDGVVTAVAGSLDDDEVLAVARGLR
ncbi:MAG: hypothetical protein U0Q15_02750 [Kineosporiaceae bacterium]